MNGEALVYFASCIKGGRVQYWAFCQQTRLQRKDRKAEAIEADCSRCQPIFPYLTPMDLQTP